MATVAEHLANPASMTSAVAAEGARMRRQRPATPARWQAALARAMESGVQVRQLAGSGAWIATSATDPAVAYELAVTDGIAHGCSCKAGEFGDPVCCHRAAYYHAAGLLDLDPPPTPAAPAVAVIMADERQDELARRRAAALVARERLAARAADPGAADRALAATNAARLARMAAGVSVAA